MNKNLKKHRGFTLIELVIVVAIIGILALMLLPQFGTVTQDAKDKQWMSNCQTIVSAIAMYQSAHGGDYPTAGTDLEPYIKGTWTDLQQHPTGATYTISNTAGGHVFTSTYPDYMKGSTATKPSEYAATSGGAYEYGPI